MVFGERIEGNEDRYHSLTVQETILDSKGEDMELFDRAGVFKISGSFETVRVKIRSNNVSGW